MKRILRLDWDIIAGIVAAVIAIVLHLLHVVEVDVLFTIVLVLLALLLIRDLRRESLDEHLTETMQETKSAVESIQFISNESEKQLWEKHVCPKIEECSGKSKVREPRWVQLPETVSFILAETEPAKATEALLSFWGEPFMSRTTGTQVPRYIFRVQGGSDLITQFVELERQHRLS